MINYFTVSSAPPKVHLFAKKCTSGKSKLKLTCLATGFYPKDITMVIRKYRTSLPTEEVESTGVRPNNDETFQLRESVYIKEDEKAEYDCYVSHRTLKDPIVEKWGRQSGSIYSIIKAEAFPPRNQG